jgi:hypothetical protein
MRSSEKMSISDALYSLKLSWGYKKVDLHDLNLTINRLKVWYGDHIFLAMVKGGKTAPCFIELIIYVLTPWLQVICRVSSKAGIEAVNVTDGQNTWS